MEVTISNEGLKTRLQIAFPKSNQDHRLQLVDINGSIFAILYAPLESEGPIRLHCEEWSLVLLAPIKSKTNILISAINIICLNEIESEKGMVNIHASNRLVKALKLSQSPEKLCELGVYGEYQLDENPAGFLQYYRSFESVVDSIYEKEAHSITNAQQKFIAGLCLLAHQIGGKTDDLTMQKILNIWHISN